MSLNILVVDDSAVMRAMIIRTLRLSGVPLGDIVEAQHGRAALDALATFWIDLALVDVNMPVMDGEELIDAIREDDIHRDLRIVVVSTEGSATRIARISEKVSAFVRKPFTPEQIRDVVFRTTGVSHEPTNGNAAEAGGALDF